MGKRQSDKERFLEKIFEEMYGDLKSFLYHYSYDKGLVEDILQETYFAAYKHADELIGNEKYKSWMYATAINKSKKMNKMNSKHNECLSLDEQLDISTAQEECEYVQFAEIREKIAGEEFELLMMHYRDNYTYEEMAQIHNKSTSCMKMKVNRIIKKLKSEFGNKNT